MVLNRKSVNLAESLHSVAVRLLRSVRSADEASGLTSSRLSALSVIVFRGPITLGDLANAEQVRPPTMTRIVNALEAEQLVVKALDPVDGRLIRIAATIKGKKAMIQSRSRRVKLLADQVQRLSDSERENLSAALVTIQGMIDRFS